MRRIKIKGGRMYMQQIMDAEIEGNSDGKWVADVMDYSSVS
jgi:hypothetical protein